MPFNESAKVVSFNQKYEKIWRKYFPYCTRRAHWDVVELLRWKEQGTVFSEIRGRMDFVFGMDEDTCAARLRELVSAGLVVCSGEKIQSSTLVGRTALLVDTYDRHAAEAACALVAVASDLGLVVQEGLAFLAGPALSRKVSAFLGKHREELEENVNAVLERTVPGPAQRVRAMRQMKSYAYRHILLKAWACCHEASFGGKGYLLIDDLHEGIYKVLGVGSQATTDYVRDMLRWDFLERLGRNDGVPRGRFAVRMARPAFDHLAAGFAEAAPSMCEAAFNLLAAEGHGGGAVDVLSFPRAG